MRKLVGIAWRFTADGRQVKPRLLSDGSVDWYEHTADGWAQVEGEIDEERVGIVEAVESEDGHRHETLVVPVTYFMADGGNPELCGEGLDEWGKIRWLKVGCCTPRGVPYTDEQIAAEIQVAIAEGARDVEADCQARYRAALNRASRTELARTGLIDSEDDRPARDFHDRRRAAARLLPTCIECGGDE